MSGSPRRSCEESWPLWLRRPGAEVSRTAQLLGRVCPPRLPLLLCLLPAQSAALRSPRPFPQQWGRGPRAVPWRTYQLQGLCGVRVSYLFCPSSGEPNPSSCLRPLSHCEGDCSPLPQPSQTSPWIFSRQQTLKGVGAGVWWRPWGVSFPEESSAGLLGHLFSVGEKELGN